MVNITTPDETPSPPHPARLRHSVEIFKFHNRNTIVAVLSILALVVLVTPAFAQSDEWIPMDITAEVTNVERVHGTLLDEWTFTVEVTNNEAYTIDVALQYVFLPTGDAMSDCPPAPVYAEYVQLRPGRSTTLSLCVVGYYDMEPDSLSVDGWLDPDAIYPTSRHFVAFDLDVCNTVWNENDLTCSVQPIARLVHDVEPTPTQCVAPAPTPITTPTEGTPNLGSAAYHKYLNDIILTFDAPVTLVDNWYEHMVIYAETEDGAIELDGLDAGGRSLMPENNTLVWLSLDYDDTRQLSGLTDMTLHIKPGTIMYGDGHSLASMLLPQVTAVP